MVTAKARRDDHASRQAPGNETVSVQTLVMWNVDGGVRGVMMMRDGAVGWNEEGTGCSSAVDHE